MCVCMCSRVDRIPKSSIFGKWPEIYETRPHSLKRIERSLPLSTFRFLCEKFELFNWSLISRAIYFWRIGTKNEIIGPINQWFTSIGRGRAIFRQWSGITATTFVFFTRLHLCIIICCNFLVQKRYFGSLLHRSSVEEIQCPLIKCKFGNLNFPYRFT